MEGDFEDDAPGLGLRTGPGDVARSNTSLKQLVSPKNSFSDRSRRLFGTVFGVMFLFSESLLAASSLRVGFPNKY